MKTGRNDPCPCGSGKKYKRCCLQSEQGDEMLWHRQHRLNQELPTRLLKFVDEAYGSMALVEAWEMYYLWDEDAPAFDPHSEQMPLFMPWFYYDWRPDPAETAVAPDAIQNLSPADLYLQRRGDRMDAFERRYLQACLASHFSFHEVLAARPGEGLTLRDLLTDAEHQVTEHAASRDVMAGDILFARTVRLGKLTVLDGCAPYFLPPETESAVAQLRAHMEKTGQKPADLPLRDYDMEMLELYHDIMETLFDDAPLEITNTDGDPLHPQKAVFAIDSPQAAFDALKDLALDADEQSLLETAEYDNQGALAQVEIPWLQRGNPQHKHWDNTVLGHLRIAGDRLTAEVNSDARADAICSLIEKRLGAGARFQATVSQSIESGLAHDTPEDEQIRQAEQAELMAQPEVQQAVDRMLSEHYLGWPDEPLPALDGRTPRQAVDDPEGRRKVTSMLNDFQRGMRQDHPKLAESLFDQLRSDLGL